MMFWLFRPHVSSVMARIMLKLLTGNEHEHAGGNANGTEGLPLSQPD